MDNCLSTFVSPEAPSTDKNYGLLVTEEPVTHKKNC